MIKFFVYIFIGLFVFMIFFRPMGSYINNLLQHDKQEGNEEKIIGGTGGYNSRVREIQKILKEAGFKPGPIDGVMGVQTRAAIKEFQKKRGLKPTGRINSITQLALNKEKEIKKSIFHSGSEINPQEAGLSNKETPTDWIKQIQMALKNAGFYKGSIDGKMGPRTKTAIRAFQKANKFNPDGVIGAKTWEELRKYLK